MNWLALYLILILKTVNHIFASSTGVFMRLDYLNYSNADCDTFHACDYVIVIKISTEGRKLCDTDQKMQENRNNFVNHIIKLSPKCPSLPRRVKLEFTLKDDDGHEQPVLGLFTTDVIVGLFVNASTPDGYLETLTPVQLSSSNERDIKIKLRMWVVCEAGHFGDDCKRVCQSTDVQCGGSSTISPPPPPPTLPPVIRGEVTTLPTDSVPGGKALVTAAFPATTSRKSAGERQGSPRGDRGDGDADCNTATDPQQQCDPALQRNCTCRIAPTDGRRICTSHAPVAAAAAGATVADPLFSQTIIIALACCVTVLLVVGLLTAVACCRWRRQANQHGNHDYSLWTDTAAVSYSPIERSNSTAPLVPGSPPLIGGSPRNGGAGPLYASVRGGLPELPPQQQQKVGEEDVYDNDQDLVGFTPPPLDAEGNPQMAFGNNTYILEDSPLPPPPPPLTEHEAYARLA